MPPFYPYSPTVIAPIPTQNGNCTHALLPFSLLTPIPTPPDISIPTSTTTIVSSLTIEDIIHQISAANIPAQSTSTLELRVKTAAPGSHGGGLSTGATIGIIGGVIVVLVILGYIVVKVCHH